MSCPSRLCPTFSIDQPVHRGFVLHFRSVAPSVEALYSIFYQPARGLVLYFLPRLRLLSVTSRDPYTATVSRRPEDLVLHSFLLQDRTLHAYVLNSPSPLKAW
jgi:hypothetical protein